MSTIGKFFLFFSTLVPVSLCCVPGAGAQSVPPVAPAFHVYRVTRPGYFSEPSVAVDSRNPAHVCVVCQSPATGTYSSDSGRTWSKSSKVGVSDYRVSGDVSVVYDNVGHAIMSCIAFDKLGTADYWAHNATRNAIVVKRSVDGGKTWLPDNFVVDSQATVRGIPFEDKPYIVADNSHGKFEGNLYIGWTEWRLTESVILFSRSTDDGITWSKPVDISDVHGLPRDDNGATEGFDGTVTPDGVVHVIWTDGCNIIYKSSSDGGKSFSQDRKIVKTAPAFFKPANVYRANGFPEISSDSSGRLFIIWSDYRNGDIDVFESCSDDGGAEWSAPTRVNDDSLHNGADQFMQWLAVDPTSGAVNAIFYDRRSDPANIKSSIVLARSTNGGKSFSNYTFDDSTFAPSNVFIGDYTGLAAYGGRVYGTWTEPVSNSSGSSKKRNRDTVVKVGVADFNAIK